MWTWLRGLFGGTRPSEAQPATEPTPSEPAPATADPSPTPPAPDAEPLAAVAQPAEGRTPPSEAPKKKKKKAKKPNKRKKRGLADTASSGPATPEAPRPVEAQGPRSLLPQGGSELPPPPPRAVEDPEPADAPAPPPSAPKVPSPVEASAPEAPDTPAASASPRAERTAPSPRQRERDTAAWVVLPKLEALLKEAEDQLAEEGADRDTLVKARRNFTQSWRALRPIPAEHREALTAAYNAHLNKLNTRIDALPDPRAQEQARAVEAREALIAEAVALAGVADLKEAIRRAKDLQRRFREAPRVPSSALGGLRERFKAAIDAVFARREEERAERLVKLSALVSAAETLTKGQDPHRAAEAMKQLQSQWKAIGGVRGPEGDALWSRFRGAGDAVFARRRAALDARFAEGLQARQGLIAEAQAMAADYVEDGDAAVQKLMTRWKRSPPAPRDQGDALWAAFRQACDRIRNPPPARPDELGDGMDALRFSPFAGLANDDETSTSG